MKRKSTRRFIPVAPLPIEQQAYNFGVRCGEAARNRDHNTGDSWRKSFRYLYTSNTDKATELQAEFDQGHRDGFGSDVLKVSGGAF